MIKKCQIALLVLGIALFGANALMAQITSSIDTYVGQLEYQDQTLTKKSAEELRLQFRLQRASQLTCWAMPSVSFYKMFEAYLDMTKSDTEEPVIVLCSGYDGVYPWLTANVTTPYTIGF